MGFFGSLNAEKYDRQYTDRVLFKRITEYFKPQALRLAIIAVTILVMSGLGALHPVVVSRGVDAVKTSQSSSGIYLICGAVLAIGVVNWLLNYARRRITVRAIADTLVTFSVDAFRSSATHDLSFYDQYSSGKVLSRITNDTRDLGNLVTIITDLVSQVVEALILAIILINIEWRLSLYVFAMMPIVFGMAIGYRSLARKVTRRGMQAVAEVNSAIKETVSGIAVAKNYRQETSIFETFKQANLLSYRVNVQRGMVLSVVFPTLNTIGGLATALIVYSGGLSVSQGLVTAGSWYLFIMSLDRFLFPVMNLASFWTQIQSGLSAAERVFALIDAEPAVVQTDSKPAPPLTGKVEFEHLDFYYKPEEPILKDFCLAIKPGENLAVVGHTGAGKSSLARLIARFYEFQGGRLLIDEQDVRTFDLQGYRKQLGIVSQVPFLFSGTVLENIQYANQEISRDEVEHIARSIGGGDWLDTLPDGLQTVVGERGARLSMGQRQLVSLMRVLAQKPAIFILDEATASIDPFTEWQIQQALNMILSKSTSILIAHRLSTVRSADRIIVLDNGEILEEGSHEGLLAREGHYASLYNTYFRHQSLAYVEQIRTIVEGD